MPDLTGDRPWAIDREILSSTTNWVPYTAPEWCRVVVIRNAHASDALLVGDLGASGAVAAPYFTIAAGGSLRIPLTGGRELGTAAARTIPLGSSTASHPVEFLLAETAE